MRNWKYCAPLLVIALAASCKSGGISGELKKLTSSKPSVAEDACAPSLLESEPERLVSDFQFKTIPHAGIGETTWSAICADFDLLQAEARPLDSSSAPVRLVFSRNAVLVESNSARFLARLGGLKAGIRYELSFFFKKGSRELGKLILGTRELEPAAMPTPDAPIPATTISKSRSVEFRLPPLAAPVAGYVIEVNPGSSESVAGTSYSYTTPSDGSYRARIRSLDAAGDESDWSPYSEAVLVDTRAPGLSLTTKPQTLTTSTAAVFTAVADESGCKFRFRLDTGTATAWGDAPSITYEGLSQGGHLFTVEAQDPAGNMTSLTYSWSIVKPTPVASFSAKPPASTNSRSASFAFASTVSASQFSYSLDGGTYTAWNTTAQASFGNLSEGQHTLRLKVQADGVPGTEISYSWAVDTTAPAVTSINGPTGAASQSSVNLSWTGEAGAQYRYKLDDADFGPWVSTTTLTYAGLSDGFHEFFVQPKDAAGNIGKTRSFGWTVKTRPNMLYVRDGKFWNRNDPSKPFRPVGVGVGAVPEFSYSVLTFQQLDANKHPTGKVSPEAADYLDQLVDFGFNQLQLSFYERSSFAKSNDAYNYGGGKLCSFLNQFLELTDARQIAVYLRPGPALTDETGAEAAMIFKYCPSLITHPSLAGWVVAYEMDYPRYEGGALHDSSKAIRRKDLDMHFSQWAVDRYGSLSAAAAAMGVSVSRDRPDFYATCESHTIPTQIRMGQTVNVKLTYRNIGNQPINPDGWRWLMNRDKPLHFVSFREDAYQFISDVTDPNDPAYSPVFDHGFGKTGAAVGLLLSNRGTDAPVTTDYGVSGEADSQVFPYALIPPKGAIVGGKTADGLFNVNFKFTAPKRPGKYLVAYQIRGFWGFGERCEQSVEVVTENEPTLQTTTSRASGRNPFYDSTADQFSYLHQANDDQLCPGGNSTLYHPNNMTTTYTALMKDAPKDPGKTSITIKRLLTNMWGSVTPGQLLFTYSDGISDREFRAPQSATYYNSSGRASVFYLPIAVGSVISDPEAALVAMTNNTLVANNPARAQTALAINTRRFIDDLYTTSYSRVVRQIRKNDPDSLLGAYHIDSTVAAPAIMWNYLNECRVFGMQVDTGLAYFDYAGPNGYQWNNYLIGDPAPSETPGAPNRHFQDFYNPNWVWADMSLLNEYIPRALGKPVSIQEFVAWESGISSGFSHTLNKWVPNYSPEDMCPDQATNRKAFFDSIFDHLIATGFSGGTNLWDANTVLPPIPVANRASQMPPTDPKYRWVNPDPLFSHTCADGETVGQKFRRKADLYKNQPTQAVYDSKPNRAVAVDRDQYSNLSNVFAETLFRFQHLDQASFVTYPPNNSATGYNATFTDSSRAAAAQYRPLVQRECTAGTPMGSSVAKEVKFGRLRCLNAKIEQVLLGGMPVGDGSSYVLYNSATSGRETLIVQVRNTQYATWPANTVLRVRYFGASSSIQEFAVGSLEFGKVLTLNKQIQVPSGTTRLEISFEVPDVSANSRFGEGFRVWSQ